MFSGSESDSAGDSWRELKCEPPSDDASLIENDGPACEKLEDVERIASGTS